MTGIYTPLSDKAATMRELLVLRIKGVIVTAGQWVRCPVGWWSLQRGSNSPPVRPNAIDFQSGDKNLLLQGDNLKSSSPTCFLFTGTRQAANMGLGTAQCRGMGPSWLSVYKYR